jgi:hypothetical protein
MAGQRLALRDRAAFTDLIASICTAQAAAPPRLRLATSYQAAGR